MEIDDAELLASLEAQEEVDRLQVDRVQDSGYGTLQENSTLSSRSSSIRSFASTASTRNSLTQNSRGDSLRGHRNGAQQGDSDSHIHNQYMADEDFPDAEFEDLPLDELDNLIFQEQTLTQSDNRDDTPRTTTLELPQSEPQRCSEGQRDANNSRTTSLKRDYQGIPRESGARLNTSTLKPLENPGTSKASHEIDIVAKVESDSFDDDMECCFEEEEAFGVQTGRISGNWPQIPQAPTETKGSFAKGSDRLSSKSSITGTEIFPIATEPALKGSHSTPQEQMYSSSANISNRLSSKQHTPENTVPPLTLSSPPFTYLCLLEKLMPQPPQQSTEIHVKAFIVTLLGKLSSNNGQWSVCATISDGTGYMDVELSDEVLRNFLGFSVAEKAVLKRDPTRKAELDAGMRRCQEELVDMCCIMTIKIEAGGRRAVVTKADPVNENILQELERRVSDWRK